MRLPSHVGLIWAQSSNRVIGRNNDIPAEFDNDLAYFKETTLGSTVLMGRKTWESLPRKPLPGRVNVILTRQKDYPVPPGVQVIHSWKELKVETEKLFIIGGKNLYDLGLRYATEIHMTVNEIDVQGDVIAPSILPVKRNPHWRVKFFMHYISVKGHSVSRYVYQKETPCHPPSTK